jgi:hypothetical protein
MNRTRRVGALCFCLRLAMVPLTASWVQAQTTDPTITAAGKTVSGDEELKALLAGLGFEPKALSQGFLISTRQDKWTLYVQIRLSGDKTKIGMNANLGKVEEDGVSGAQWKGLLEANQDIDPSVFFYDKEAKKLYIHRVLDNRAITPGFLKDQIEKFNGNIRETKDLWSFTK